MNTDRIIDAVAEIDPIILDSVAAERYKRSSGCRSKPTKNNTTLFRRIAAVAAAVVVSTTAIFIVVPLIQKRPGSSGFIPETRFLTPDSTSIISNNASDSNDEIHYGHMQPFIRPTSKFLYKTSPYDVLLPRWIPDGYYVADSYLILGDKSCTPEELSDDNALPLQRPYLELMFFNGDSGFFIIIHDYVYTGIATEIYESGSNKYRPDDKALRYIIKAEDLLNEGPELIRKTGSQQILCGDYVVEYYDYDYRKEQKIFSIEEIYDIITSSRYFRKIS